MNAVNCLLTTIIIGFVFVEYTDSANCADYSRKTNNTCSQCVSVSLNCYWCKVSGICKDRKSVIVGSSECDGKWYSWGQCAVPDVVLVIVVPIVVLLVLIFLCCCLYCICCRDCCRARKERNFIQYTNFTTSM